MAGTTEGQGLIARVTTALRYAFTGQSPQGWFGPLEPLPPQAPEEVRGRGWDYQVGANINFRPRASEALSFDKLKQLASHPIVAMLIQRQKDKMAALDWEVKPRKAEDAEKADDPQIAEIVDFFRYPDKEHDWGQWLSGLLDQLLVLDATSIYAAPTRLGGVYALQLLDGATIKPIIDLGGRRPLAPLPAYQQVLKGLPAIDYTADELVYFPQTYRPGKLYGYSRVEQVYDLIEAAISRLKSQRGYFDHGNIGDGYFTAPEGWANTDNVNMLEEKWNSWMTGDPAIRRRATFLPHGVEWHATKVDILTDEYDEFLIRLLCFPFGVAPQVFMKQAGLGDGGSDNAHEQAEEGGLAPLMQFVERLMSLLIAKWWKRPDLEFSFTDDRELDPKTAAEIEDIRLKNGSLTLDEARDRRGEKPYSDGSGSKPLIYGGAVQLLEEAIKPPEPMPAPSAFEAGVAQPPAPKGNGAGGEAEEDDEADDDAEDGLAKAASRAEVIALAAQLGAYLAAKGAAIADQVADTLVKAAPSDDHSRRIEEEFEEVNWDWSDLSENVEPAIANVAVAAGVKAAADLGLFTPETLKLVTARAVAYAQDRAAEMVGMSWEGGKLVPNPNAEWTINGATRDMLRRSITTAMEEGQSNEQLKRTIRDNAAFSPARAANIARSETALADIRGAAAGWIESDVVTGARFDAAPDCCDNCQAENGKIVPLTKPDDLGLPHPSCRCGWLPVLDDDDTGA